MKIGMIFAAGALAATGIALTPAPAEARTYVSIGIGSPGYYGYGYRDPYYGGYYGRGYGYYDRGYYGRPRHWRGDYGYRRPLVCRYDRWGRQYCRRARW